MSGKIRVDKLFSNLGYVSRSNINAAWLRQNAVMENGIPVGTSKSVIDPKRLTVNGAPIPYLEPLHLAVNKPQGYICSRDREGSHKIIYDLLPPAFYMRSPVLSVTGRLDKWASGLVLLSQDGLFVSSVIEGAKVDGTPIEKVYEVKFQKPFTGQEELLFASGKIKLEHEDSPCLPAGFEVIDIQERLARLTLFEGRYHQIRRMAAAIGNQAISVHRVQVGPIHLKDLPLGKWRQLTQQEYESVLEQASTRAYVQRKTQHINKLEHMARKSARVEKHNIDQEEKEEEEEEEIAMSDLAKELLGK
eukprot:TRINITY_DN1425_c0_g3_i2.p1 TRINITY_DN1425_c0_g3~~TRINITY_DN1425_c0_g3_i2.p1  ORF type:complete len:304 (+),score=36.31 TRINITY_DN1425_c0_g3_i2:35-946(+)